MDKDGHLSAAYKHSALAMELDERFTFRKANDEYQSALENFMLTIRLVTDINERKQLVFKASKLMDRAELIKGLITQSDTIKRGGQFFETLRSCVLPETPLESHLSVRENPLNSARKGSHIRSVSSPMKSPIKRSSIDTGRNPVTPRTSPIKRPIPRSSPLKTPRPRTTASGMNFSTPRTPRPIGSSTKKTTPGSRASNRGSSKTPNAASKKGFRPRNDMEKNILEHLVDLNGGSVVQWEDISGLEAAKSLMWETVILPATRPELFTGLREPTRGILLYGPPGTGKTLLAKAVAAQASCSFFSIHPSMILSKWLGESSKLVSALFHVARKMSPSVIFIDEIDSLLSSRGSNESEASRRIKTEFLVQMDGLIKEEEEESRILVIGATNLPQTLDDAVIRRMPVHVYIPLPEPATRGALLTSLLCRQGGYVISNKDINKLVSRTKGYSGSDIVSLCKHSAMWPIRELGTRIASVDADELRPVSIDDVVKSMGIIRPSVSQDLLKEIERFSAKYSHGLQ